MSSHDQDLTRIPFTCSLDCGGPCELVACVADGKLVRIDTPPGRPDTPESPRRIPCIRGRAHRRLLASEERLLTPLRRVGPRSSDRFGAIGWDAALDEVADRLTTLRERHGAEALLHFAGAGTLGGRGISGGAASRRTFSFWGNVTGTYGNMSAWCEIQASQWMLGLSRLTVHTASLVASRLIILWGNNPAETRRDVNLAYFIGRRATAAPV